MQTVINNDLAMSIPGTHGNGQPFVVDTYIAGADVAMGKVAALDANGRAVPYSATASTPIGVFVDPREHVRMVLPSDTSSLVVRTGDTVGVAKKGAWYVAIPTADATNWVKGAKVKYDSATYDFLVSASDTVAEILEVSGGQALIRFL